jgi:SMI1-KNR4 cell-wall
MTDDEVLKSIAKHAAESSGTLYPRATDSAVSDAERALALSLPRFYVRLLTEVANGGFGPGYGVVGLPPEGYWDSDMGGGSVVETYASQREVEDRRYRTPVGLICLCNWGCATYSYLDCVSSEGRVVTAEPVETSVRYTATSPSIREWLRQWADGVDVGKDMREVVGYREGINPFTGRAHRYPIVRMKGAILDFADRA